MQPWQIIWRDIKRFIQRRRIFALDDPAARKLKLLATRKHASPHEVLDQLLNEAVLGDEENDFVLQRWDSLSERERQVTALICKKMTNKEIAAQMCISPSTVKTYVERILSKYGIHDRETLRALLANYDLSQFE